MSKSKWASYDELIAAWQRGELSEQDVEDVEPSEEGLMTRREVAEFLAVSIRTVQRMQARGTLTRVTVPGVAGARYRIREVKALLEEKTSRPWTGDRPRWG